MDSATAVVATSAVTSPVWLPWLQAVSQAAALIAPILGATWLLVQIWARITEVRRLKKGAAE